MQEYKCATKTFEAKTLMPLGYILEWYTNIFKIGCTGFASSVFIIIIIIKTMALSLGHSTCDSWSFVCCDIQNICNCLCYLTADAITNTLSSTFMEVRRLPHLIDPYVTYLHTLKLRLY